MEDGQLNQHSIGKPMVLILYAQTTPPLKELDEEAANLREALLRSGICDADVLPGANLERIFTELRERGDRIIAIHFAGHANGQGIMLRQSANSASGEKLAHIAGMASALEPLRKLKLVFLNGCETEDQVPHFTKIGIPAVIATHVKIGDRVATNFATEFYRCLASGHDIASSFKRAESNIRVDKGENYRGAYSEGAETTDAELDRWPWELHGDDPGTAWKLADAASAEADARLAEDGLAALNSLASNPVVSSAIQSFRAEFTQSRDQLQVLSAYKGLHDLLHNIQKGCQEQLMLGARCDDADDVNWDLIEGAEMTIREELEKQQDEGLSTCLPEEDTAWLLILAEAADKIETAVEEEDLKLLEKGEWMVSRQISIHLSEMNTRLNEKAKKLHLESLVDGLRCISVEIEKSDTVTGQAEQFEAALGAMDRLNGKLAKLVGQHHAWQAVDRELRPLHASVMRNDVRDLEMGWDDLNDKVEKLRDAPDEDWAKRIASAAGKLDQAIKNGLENKILRSFYKYYRQTTQRFVSIDKQLRAHAEEMRGLGQSLSAVLAELN